MLKKKENADPVGQSKLKQYLFYTIIIFIPVLIFFILEICLRLFQYGGDIRLFVSIPDKQSPYYGINTEIGKRYFYYDSFSPTPRKDLFLKQKPQNGYRIFVLGGSSAAGFPYGNNITFPRILHRRLVDTFPDKRIEVINISMTAINSYTLLDFMDEILDQKPDALLIYLGHNEYYGALGAGSNESIGNNYLLIRLYLKLQKYKTVVLFRNILINLTKIFKGDEEKQSIIDVFQTEMAAIVKNKKIVYHDKTYLAGKNQFYRNLSAICGKAKQVGIGVILSELVSNIRDQVPFSSRKTSDYPAAISIYKKAQKLEQQGNFTMARQAYYYAKDLDVVRFRAPEEFNQIIDQTGQQYNIPVIPMKDYFENGSSHGLIGNTLMCEHLHPNIDGYFLMAEAFYRTMQDHHFISKTWNKELIKPSSYYRKNWGWTTLDSVIAHLHVKHLKGGWPFKKVGLNMVLHEFQPKDIIDSIAIEKLKSENFTLEMGHIRIAQYYLKQGKPDKAFEEYKALIYTVPYLDLFYEPAVRLLLSNQDYKQAYQLLGEGIRYNQSGFMYKWLGQISLVLGFTEQGIINLNRAREKGERDEQLLYNLARAYYNIAQIEMGDRIQAELKRLYPKSATIQILADFRKTVIQEKLIYK